MIAIGKAYRYASVRKAVATWTISEWFSAQDLLPKAVECLPQKHCSITVYGVSAMLRRLEGRGLLASHTTGAGVKEYRRIESEWE